MIPSDFKKQLQNSTAMPAVVLFSGEEDFLAEQLLSQIAQSGDENFRTWDFVRADLDHATLASILEDTATMSFSGQRRYVIVDRPSFLTSKGSLEKSDEQHFLSYLQRPESENTLIINAVGTDLDKRKKTVKTLVKNSEQVDFQPLSEKELFHVVKTRLATVKAVIDDSVINYYLQRLAFNLRLVMNNLEKVILYAASGENINRETIDALVTPELNESAFDLVTDINRRKMPEAIQLYNDLLDRGEAPIRINALLLSQYRLLIQAKALSLNDTQLSKTLKIHPYRAKLANQTVRPQTMMQLSDAYLDLAKIDFRLKSTTLEPALLFEMFLSGRH